MAEYHKLKVLSDEEDDSFLQGEPALEAHQ